MINLEDEAHRQKLKLSNIFLQQLKYSAALLVLDVLSTPSWFSKLMLYVILVQLTFNLLVFIYLVFLKKDFPRVEFFLIYTVNIFIFLAMLISAIRQYVATQSEQYDVQMFTRAVIFASLQKELDILVIMILPFEISNRQVNICTSNLFVFLLLSMNSQDSCINQGKIVNLGIMLVNVLILVFFTLFNLLIFKYPSMKKQIRNFLTLSALLLFLSYFASYLAIAINTQKISCPQINYIYTGYLYVVPINLLAVLFVIYQEVNHCLLEQENEQLISQSPHLNQKFASQHYMMAGNLKQNRQINQQYSKKLSTLKSQQSQSINSQSGHYHNQQSMQVASNLFNKEQSMQVSSNTPVFQQTQEAKQEMKESHSPKQIEKMGTSQFGASQHNNPQMLHSWANIQNNNPFFGQAESVLYAQLSEKKIEQSKPSLEESVIKQEGDNSFDVANPMDSGSQITVK